MISQRAGSPRTFTNVVTNDRLARRDFQAQDLLSLLQRKRDEDAEFAYEFELDDQQRLMHIIWTFPQQKRAYARFNDTVVFDNTYKSNYFGMPFGIFTGNLGPNKLCDTVNFATSVER